MPVDEGCFDRATVLGEQAAVVECNTVAADIRQGPIAHATRDPVQAALVLWREDEGTACGRRRLAREVLRCLHGRLARVAKDERRFAVGKLLQDAQEPGAGRPGPSAMPPTACT